MSTVYGLIGAGMMGREHVRNIRLLDGAEVGAIADPVETERRKAMALAGGQAQEFADHRTLLAETDCDAFVIATPNDSHCRILLDLLAADKPVLVEKPLCTTSTDCREVLSAAAGRSAPVWVAMEYHYMPALEHMLREVKNGKVGSPVMMSVREHRFPFLEKVGNWNRFNDSTGGTLVEKCCHFWDLMRRFLGSDPVRVFASASMAVNHLDECHDGRRPDMIDNAYAVVDFANGARGMLDLCMFGEGSHWQEAVSVTGPKARIEALVPPPARFVRDGKERLSRVETSWRTGGSADVREFRIDDTILNAGDHHGATFHQHRRFLELVRSGTGEPEVSLEDGCWAVLVGEAAELSARQGQAVELAEIGSGPWPDPASSTAKPS